MTDIRKKVDFNLLQALGMFKGEAECSKCGRPVPTRGQCVYCTSTEIKQDRMTLIEREKVEIEKKQKKGKKKGKKKVVKKRKKL